MSSKWKGTGLTDQLIKEIQQYASNHYGIEKIILFGSRARGDHTPQSDIDIMISTTRLSRKQENLIEYDIQQMNTPLKIDVLFESRLKKVKLVNNIMKEGVEIYGQGEAKRKA